MTSSEERSEGKEWRDETLDYYDQSNVEETPIEKFYPGRLRINNLGKVLQGRKFSRALDAGCGTGRFLSFLSSRADEVHSFDFSLNRLELFNSPNKVQADAEAIPYPDKSFDLILCSELIQHIRPEAVKKTISEMDRVLSEDGIIVAIFKNGENPLKSKPKNPITWFTRTDIQKLFNNFRVTFHGDRLMHDKLTFLLRKPYSQMFEKADSALSDKMLKFCDSLIAVCERK